MTFNDNVSASSGRVGGGGGGRGRGGMVAGGAGGLGILGVVLFLFTGDPGFIDGGQQQVPAAQQTQAGQGGECTGAAANEDTHCRMVLTAEALDRYWVDALPQQAGIEYRPPAFDVFRGATDTACGYATSQVGPFYCPADENVYLDTDFFETLETQLGGENAPLAQMYIVAHEWGHHIQSQTGAMQAADRQDTGPQSDGVRLELQADCYAGMFIGQAARTVDAETGEYYLQPPTREEIDSALTAAAAVGDDHIQAQAGQVSNPESWTHGSSDARMDWFATGYNEDSMQRCDTWAAQQP